MNEQLKNEQLRAFALLSKYLNYTPDRINSNLIDELCATLNCDKTHAFTLCLAAMCQLNTEENASDKLLFNNFFAHAVKQLNVQKYENNAYYKNIHFSDAKIENWELRYEFYKPYEAFIFNDIVVMPDGRQIPQIGFFDEKFSYPAVLENNRIWMTVTPNEIETMKQPIQQASGNVLTFGLGLGYYAYMVSEKENVTAVTIVDKDISAINLFTKHILPQFAQAKKIKIVQADAFEYAQKQMIASNFDFVFTDLWHDVSDGIPLYLKMKKYEKACPKTAFSYWIEKSMLCYL